MLNKQLICAFVCLHVLMLRWKMKCAVMRRYAAAELCRPTCSRNGMPAKTFQVTPVPFTASITAGLQVVIFVGIWRVLA